MLNTAYASNGRARIGNGIGALVAWSHSELSASRSITEAACNHADSRSIGCGVGSPGNLLAGKDRGIVSS